MKTISPDGSFVHAQYLKMIGMTPEESRNMEIRYSFKDGPFGKMMVASTGKGICSLVLAEKETKAVEDLKKKFQGANCLPMEEPIHLEAVHLISKDWKPKQPITLHLKGTGFQLEVWEALLNIPFGKLATYGDVARAIGRPKAYRAVGSAVGDNPVFFLVPCHRVIQSSGAYGNYFWGPAIKKAIIGWESSDAVR